MTVRNKVAGLVLAAMLVSLLLAHYVTGQGSDNGPAGCYHNDAQADSFFETEIRSRPHAGAGTERAFDLNADGSPERIILDGGSLEVYAGADLLWSTPDDWWVDFFLVGDANNDGAPELNMVVWKKGSFGPVKPFWVEEEDERIKCHLFLFRLEGEKIRPVWQSSNLPHPVYKAVLEDTNSDGENELVVTGGCYHTPGFEEVSIWKWDEWGFRKME